MHKFALYTIAVAFICIASLSLTGAANAQAGTGDQQVHVNHGEGHVPAPSIHLEESSKKKARNKKQRRSTQKTEAARPTVAKEDPWRRPKFEEDFTFTTTIGILGVGALAGGAGLIGGYAWGASRHPCPVDFQSLCFDELLGGIAYGTGIGMGATALAVWGTGELLGFDGSVLAAIAGSTGGLLMGVTLGAVGAVARIESSFLVAIPVSMAAGAVIGYFLSLDSAASAKGRARTGALMGYDGSGFHLDLPTASFTKTEQETRVDVALLGGTF